MKNIFTCFLFFNTINKLHMKNSTQIFNIGDYVKTNRGSIGIIVKPENWAIVDKDRKILCTISTEHTAEYIEKKMLPLYPNGVAIVRLSALVKLGNTIVKLSQVQLNKIKKLTIETVSNTTNLPIEDAFALEKIYKRNNIEYKIF